MRTIKIFFKALAKTFIKTIKFQKDDLESKSKFRIIWERVGIVLSIVCFVGVGYLIYITYILENRTPCEWVADVQAIKDNPKRPKFERGNCPKNMVFISAGRFMAGRSGDEDNPLLEMELEGYCIDQYEVTRAEYGCTMGKNQIGASPVNETSWFEARDYCAKVGKRLPTEWEWEKAAKGGTQTKYFWGDQPLKAQDYGYFCHFAPQGSRCYSGTKIALIGSYLPNPYGLYDVVGNVSEWTANFYEFTKNKDKTIAKSLGSSSPIIQDRDTYLDYMRNESHNRWYRTMHRGSNMIDFRVNSETNKVHDRFFLSRRKFSSDAGTLRHYEEPNKIGIRCAKSL